MVSRPGLPLTVGLAILMTLAAIGSVHAASPAQIRSLVSTVTVFPSGSLEVREQLTLVTTGDSITRTLSQDVGDVRLGSGGKGPSTGSGYSAVQSAGRNVSRGHALCPPYGLR